MKNEWWSSLSFDVQNAYDRKDTKTFYKLISQAFGPQSSSVVPLKSKDGSVIIKDTDGIKNRWTEHFRDLFHNPSDIDQDVINGLPQHEIINEMNIPPDLEEVKATIKEINTGKAPGLDGIPVELLLHGGEQIASVIHSLILDIFEGNPVPKDWVDAI